MESRVQLLHAIDNPPISSVEYQIKDYCVVKINELVDSIKLKPKNTILVEWDCIDKHNPVPISIQFKGLSHLNENEHFTVTVSPKRFQKFINSHTSIISSVGYK